MQKSIWIFGIIAGAFGASLEYLFFKNTSFSANTMYLSKTLILAICIVFGLVLVKKLIGGTISIARTLLSGMLIAFIRSAVMIGSFLVLYYPSGEFYELKLQESYSQAEKKTAADEDILPADKESVLELTKQQIAGQFKPLGYSGLLIAESLIIGFIISILAAAFISKNMMYTE